MTAAKITILMSAFSALDHAIQQTITAPPLELSQRMAMLTEEHKSFRTMFHATVGELLFEKALDAARTP